VLINVRTDAVTCRSGYTTNWTRTHSADYTSCRCGMCRGADDCAAPARICVALKDTCRRILQLRLCCCDQVAGERWLRRAFGNINYPHYSIDSLYARIYIVLTVFSVFEHCFFTALPILRLSNIFRCLMFSRSRKCLIAKKPSRVAQNHRK